MKKNLYLVAVSVAASALPIGIMAAQPVVAQSLPRCIGPLCIKKPKTEAPAPAPVPAPVQSAAAASAASSGQYAKNGRACVDSLCLGDGIDALETVQWDQAIRPGSERSPEPSASRSLGRGETNRINGRYRGSFGSIIGYLADGRFDNGALAGMRGVTAACETQSMQGTFTTGSGNPTTVLVSMVADPSNPGVHRWEIRRISRKVPNAVGAARDAAEKQLEERYRQFTSRYRKPGGDMLQTNSFSGFQYTLSAPAVPNEAALLKQHPACGGNGGGPVSID